MGKGLFGAGGVQTWLTIGALLCGIGVVAANGMSFWAARGEFPTLAWARPGGTPASFGKVDYNATGSIPQGGDRTYTRIRSVLDKPVSIAPCTGKIVSP